ncbi:hypothetical protein Tco_0400050 [Tanacetum coccineum]
MTGNKLQEIRLAKRGITTTSPTPPWCNCGGCGSYSRLGRRHSGGVKRLSTARHPRGVAAPQPDTTWCGCGGCTVVRPPPQWQDPEVSRCFMGCSAVALANPPPTARHGGDSGWESRRCCGGRGNGMGGWRDEVE